MIEKKKEKEQQHILGVWNKNSIIGQNICYKNTLAIISLMMIKSDQTVHLGLCPGHIYKTFL